MINVRLSVWNLIPRIILFPLVIIKINLSYVNHNMSSEKKFNNNDRLLQNPLFICSTCYLWFAKGQ